MTIHPTGVDLLRHFLATLKYRTNKSIEGAPSEYVTYSPGRDVRTPVEILAHMGDVLESATMRLRGDESPRIPRTTPPEWAEQCARFEGLLKTLDAQLSSAHDLPKELAFRVLQGPFSDAMTHAGQLAMLRRLCDAPVPAENFYLATIGEV